MELQEFITATLKSIIEGASEAATDLDRIGSKGFINPSIIGEGSQVHKLDVQNVDFDVSVTVEKQEKSGGGWSFKLHVIEARFDRDAEVKSIGESRVKFSVPISLPYTRVEIPNTPGPQAAGSTRLGKFDEF